jgi:2-C-methyl-D-erythritol 4-phosphate cytidylyltransferase
VSVVALVPAAGRGERLGAVVSGVAVPKALALVAGETLLGRTVRGLLASGCVDQVVVAAPESYVDTMREIVAGQQVQVVVGGAERTNSVRSALAVVDESGLEAVLVHDAARAFTPAEVIHAVVDAIRGGAAAAIPVLPVSDTIKRVDADTVLETVDRSVLRAVQTPQGFAPDVLREAYQRFPDAHTDDAGMVERLGVAVRTVPGHPHAMKITTPFDLAIAEAVLGDAP